MRPAFLSRLTAPALAAFLACVQALLFVVPAVHEVVDATTAARAAVEAPPGTSVEAPCPADCRDHDHHVHAPASCLACRAKVIDAVASQRLAIDSCTASLLATLPQLDVATISRAAAGHPQRGPPPALRLPRAA